jgi:hypothetical protein
VAMWLVFGAASGHERTRPDLDGWFQGLKSEQGPCCSNADGTAVADVDWDVKDGHYRVRIDNKWIDVPDSAVLHQPNLFGPTMVWPLRTWAAQNENIIIRCFIVGTLT